MSRHWPAQLLVLMACTMGAAAATPITLRFHPEADSHLMGPASVIRTPWRDLTAHPGSGPWFVRLHVTPQGTVSRARLLGGPAERRADALRAARALRFKPFEVAGRQVATEFDFAIQSEMEDYAGPPDRVFPQRPDPAQVRIALTRGGCFGACPGYRVEVRGDGRVAYRGSGFVVVEGTHHWKIDPAAAARLIDRFRQADYLKLDGYYRVDVTDIPTFITSVRIGQHRKFVYNHGGGLPDGPPPLPAAPDTTSDGTEPEAPPTPDPGPLMPRMPAVVTELERAVDELSGVLSWVEGDAHTMQRLREARWNFRTPSAARGLRQLVRACNVELAEDFIRAGAPVRVAGLPIDEASTMSHAAGCGSVRLVRLLEARGALATRQDAMSFLQAAVRNGHPEMVEMALKHRADVRGRGDDGKPFMFTLADTRIFYEDEPVGDAVRDWAAVVHQLVAAGADPNVRDKKGNTPLHEVRELEVARALVKAGADPNARNKRGETPLFSGYYADINSALIRVGADVSARDLMGQTALFYQRYADTTQVLIDAGADVNATAFDGSTPLETAVDEAAALVLVQAGATVPRDGARLSALIARAREWRWAQLLPTLLKASNRDGEGDAMPRR